MKNKLLILTAYDVLGLLFLGSLVFLFSKNDFTVYHDFNMGINDTISYDPLNLDNGIEIVSIGRETNNFSFLDKHGNAITNKELWDNFEKYGKKCVWGGPRDSSSISYCDSSITDHTPRVAINNVKTSIGFHYKGDVHSSYVTTKKIVLLLKYVFIALVLILIRRFLQLTLLGEIFSAKGTKVFKYLFILSILWVVFEYSSYELIFKSLMHESNRPTIYGANGRSMSISFTKSYEFYNLYYYIVFIVVTFFLYMAFKHGQKVKSENDLTV